MEAVERRQFGVVEVLLRGGADPNLQRRESEETVSHCALRSYRENKEQVIRLLLLLLRHKANFHLLNHEGKSVFEAALAVGLDLSECAGEDC